MSRRALLAALGTLPAVAAPIEAQPSGPRPAEGTPSPSRGLGDLSALSLVEATGRFVRMRCAPGGEWAMWSYGGVLLAKPEGELARPLVRVEGVSLNRARPRAAGGFDYELDEVGYYCDLASGEVLDTFVNPFTGRTVRPAHYRSAQKTHFVAGRVVPAEKLPQGIEYRGEITTLAAVGGLISMAEDLYVRIPARPAEEGRPARPERISTSLATHTASEADLERPDLEWVDCTLHYGTLNSFAPWLGMDGVAGVQNMRLVGRKLPIRQFDALPRWLLERVRRDHPKLLSLAG